MFYNPQSWRHWVPKCLLTQESLRDVASARCQKGSLWGTGGAAIFYDPRKEAASDVLISFFLDSLRSQLTPTKYRVLIAGAGQWSGLLT